MQVIVLMAGDGRRFLGTEFYPYKPLINTKGKTILEWTLSSLPFLDINRISYAIRDEHNEKYAVTNYIRSRISLLPNFVYFEKPTRGNLETALISVSMLDIDPEENLLILDSDNLFDGSNVSEWLNRDGEFAGITYFQPLDNSHKWCFAMMDGERVTALREKDPDALSQGGKPMVGVFYFSKASLFLKSADAIINGGMTVRNEFFMSQSIQWLIDNNQQVVGKEVYKVHPLGTPEDVRLFQSI